MRPLSLRTVLLTLAAVATPALAQPRLVTVYAFDFDFSINRPGEGPIEQAVINPGDRVQWVMLHDFHNTVACVGQAEFWESPIMQMGEVFSWDFTTPGVYTYYCSPHGSDNGDGTATGMQGTITVLPTPGSAPILALGLLAAGRSRRRAPRGNFA